MRLGGNRFTGDLHRYRIQATTEEVSVDITVTGEVPPWRPSTGYMLFGADRSKEFAWLPAVPQGAVTITYSVGGEQYQTTGVGYHDHNWGNVALMKIVHDWYWARGQAGPYSVIASYITAAERYGFEPIPIFMLAREQCPGRRRRRQGHLRAGRHLHRRGDRQARRGGHALLL